MQIHWPIWIRIRNTPEQVQVERQVFSENKRCFLFNGTGSRDDYFLKAYKIKSVSFQCVLEVIKFFGSLYVKTINYIVLLASGSSNHNSWIWTKCRRRSTSMFNRNFIYLLYELERENSSRQYADTKCVQTVNTMWCLLAFCNAVLWIRITLMRIRIQLITLMRIRIWIRIRLFTLMRIRILFQILASK